MSVKPVAWMNPDTRHIMPHAERSAMNSSGQQGMCVPLYSAPAPELAEALQRLVKWNDSSEPFTQGDADEFKAIVSTSRQLLARITPK